MKGIELPEIGHVGFIVENADAAAEAYSPSEVRAYNFIPTRAWSYGNKIHDCMFRIVLISPKSGGAKIEFVQFISGTNTPHETFFKQFGSAIHHLAYYVENYDMVRKQFAELPGAEITFEAEIEDAVMGKRSSFYVNIPGYPCTIEISKRPTKL